MEKRLAIPSAVAMYSDATVLLSEYGTSVENLNGTRVLAVYTPSFQTVKLLSDPEGRLFVSDVNTEQEDLSFNYMGDPDSSSPMHLTICRTVLDEVIAACSDAQNIVS